MYVSKIPRIIKILFTSAWWKYKTKDKVIYLTFDDGPTPEITNWVLNLLDEYRAKATFFCLGRQVVKHPDLYQKLIAQGHSVGNHTWDHPAGWDIEDSEYYAEIDKTASLVDSNLFRPPFGKISWSQYQYLKRKIQLVMWDIVCYDYDPEITGEQCKKFAMKGIEPGSIIVFHDSAKAFPRLKVALPHVLKKMSAKGYTFLSLPQSQYHGLAV